MLSRKDLFNTDLKHPEFIAHFEALLPGLRTRRLSDLQALHYHITRTGAKCLDLNVSAATRDELDAAVAEKIDALWNENSDQLMTAAPDEEWMRMIQAPLKYTRPIRLPQFLNLVIGTGDDGR
jgi:hypothetical protein